jgi:hypothetical protein
MLGVIKDGDVCEKGRSFILILVCSERFLSLGPFVRGRSLGMSGYNLVELNECLSYGIW